MSRHHAMTPFAALQQLQYASVAQTIVRTIVQITGNNSWPQSKT
jgi:hypothetical protein